MSGTQLYCMQLKNWYRSVLHTHQNLLISEIFSFCAYSHNHISFTFWHTNHAKIVVHRCVECETDFCEKCKKVHLNIKAVSNHKLLTHEELKENVGVAYAKSENCLHHKEHELNLYCEPCDAMICRDCTLINHKNHNYGFVKEFTTAKRRKLQEEVKFDVMAAC